MKAALFKLLQLFCDSRDGSLSPSKGGYTLFMLVFTYKMLRSLPDDPWMWVVYGATVGGVEVCKKYFNLKFDPQPSINEPQR
ncbi:hypothetical protein [Hydrocarboniphaga effusa]|uniref:hypothetical protein n=1 Tax=Hydrocarboniphaga effusa TaxID=243629 RepID=UPI003BAC4072